MEKYYPQVGDVFTMSGKEDLFVAIPGGYNNEDMSSMSYDRGLRYMPIGTLTDAMSDTPQISETWLRKLSLLIDIRGVTLPPFTKADVAPFVFDKVTMYDVRRKTPKTVTIYE